MQNEITSMYFVSFTETVRIINMPKTRTTNIKNGCPQDDIYGSSTSIYDRSANFHDTIKYSNKTVFPYID